MGEPGPGWRAWTGNDRGRGPVIAAPGSYMKVRKGEEMWCWYIRDPRGDVCTLRDNHQITEHPDGTITASPSIVNPNGSYHGFLRQGVWT